MADDSLGLADDVLAAVMHHRPVAASDCVWQTRLQRRGSPLQDCTEHRILCLLRPSAPAVAVTVHRFGRVVHMAKQFRRKDVLERGSLVVLELTFSNWPEDPMIPLLRLEPTSEPDPHKMLRYPDILWRAATPQERPDATTVLLSPGMEAMTGRAVEVAAIVPDTRIGLILVDLEDVKGLPGGRWRLRQASALRDWRWRILATGARGTAWMDALE
jgi:hypothetical protein